MKLVFYNYNIIKYSLTIFEKLKIFSIVFKSPVYQIDFKKYNCILKFISLLSLVIFDNNVQIGKQFKLKKIYIYKN